ncbi:MAG: beta-propeller fold lactonase family protein [Ralstonia sp.]|uniref:beta-propeller fold lactonase family protein n=1 Tax=Ralstonia sp. TaxID=54061 RepID=UPI003F7E62BE
MISFRARRHQVTFLSHAVGAVLIAALASCGGNADVPAEPNVANTYTIGGAVSGLAGTGLVLQDNGGNDLTIAANGGFSFTTPLANGASYSVTVKTPPGAPAQTCTVNNGNGTVAGANVNNVAVVCTTNTYTVSGAVSGLAGTGLVLQDNGGNDLPIAGNGSFTFTTPLASGASYSVTVKTPPGAPAQTCTVNNGNGTVAGANVNNVAVVCATNTYTVGGAVSGLAGSGLVLQDNGGNDLAIAANGSFTFTAPLASGASYAVTIKTQPYQPLQTCTVTGNSGTAMANVTSVAVTCGAPVPRFAYVANNGSVSNSVSAYAVNATTGALTAIGSAPTDIAPASVTVDPTGKFAYVANTGSNTVSAYAIDATTGALAAIGSVGTGSAPNSVTVDPSGKFAYVVNAGNYNVSAYAIDATTGALTAIVSVGTGANPYSVTIDPSGKFAYVANEANNTVSAYVIDSTTGALTAIGSVPTGTAPTSVTVDPSGKFAYVANYNSNSVSAYAIDGTTGALTAIGSVGTGILPYSVTVDPSGKFVYVANTGSNTVSAYAINATTGALTGVGAVVTGSIPYSIVVTR